MFQARELASRTVFTIGVKGPRSSTIMRALLLVTALAASGCVSGVYRYKDQAIARRVAVISAEEAAERGLRGEPLSMSFADGSEGTEVMINFLAAAEQAGAKQISDIEIETTTAHAGTCASRVEPVTHVHTRRTTTLRPGTGVTKSHTVMKPVTQTVTEYQYRCRTVSKPHTVTETYYESQYDYSSKTYRRVPRTRTRTEYRSESECRSEPTTRTVTRYEHQYESRFVPPQWDVIYTNYTDRQLIESEPSCSSASSDIGEMMPHRVRAIIYR